MNTQTPNELANKKRAEKLRRTHKQLDKLWDDLAANDLSYEANQARMNIGKAMDQLMIAVHYLEED